MFSSDIEPTTDPDFMLNMGDIIMKVRFEDIAMSITALLFSLLGLPFLFTLYVMGRFFLGLSFPMEPMSTAECYFVGVEIYCFEVIFLLVPFLLKSSFEELKRTHPELFPSDKTDNTDKKD